jgi:ABC-2 type transport system ATP-binding protein
MLDEPSSGLDPRGVTEVRDIIRGLKRHDRLIFFSSHILNEVTEVCDEVALINRGKLLFYDTLEGVTTMYGDAAPPVEVTFTRPISDADLKDRVGALEQVASFDRVDPHKVRLKVTGGRDGQAAVFEAVAAMHLGAVGFREAGNSLEQIYMQQIEKGDQA